MATLSEALAIAIQHQQAGQCEPAEQIYRQILAVDANCVDALHLLGVIAFQTGKLALAVELYRRALQLEPNFVEAHYNLGTALKDQGQLDEAVACFARALELKPDYVAAHINLGNVLQAQGKLDDAANCFRRALVLKPDNFEAHYNLGNALHGLGKFDEAADSYRRVLELMPDHAETHCNLGSALQDLGNLNEAAQCFRRAIELRPNFAEAHGNLGSVLKFQGQLDEAVACYRRALKLDPGNAVAHYNLGNAFQAQEKLDEALNSYGQAVALKTDYAAAHNNLGSALQDFGRLTEAVKSHELALSFKPDFAEAHCNLGNAFQSLGQFDDALTHYSRSLELKPDYAYAHLSRANLKLLMGDFDGGWPEYEWRWKTDELQERMFSQPKWDGNELRERTILLHAEQGLGDTIQFIRYATEVKRQNPEAIIVVECQQPLTNLLSSCLGIDRLVARGKELLEFDVHAPLLSVPRILGTSLQTIPGDIPYLFADSALIHRWHSRLPQERGLKIGINWRGRPKTRQRDIPVELFKSLARIPGVHLISLQRDATQTDCCTEDGDSQPIIHLGNDLDTASGAFMDTAAVMVNLDLVISSDTSVAHLAGALGVPVWVALPFVPEWRWLLDRSDSPWYPTMRLFRQQQPGEWLSVFEHIRTIIENRLNSRVSS